MGVLGLGVVGIVKEMEVLEDIGIAVQVVLMM